MMEERAKRKLTAILSADVKGYSRLMGEDEKATVETLKRYREVMGELIRQYRGRVVDSPGDNVLSEFASVVDAVECAVKIQEELKTRNEGLPENRRMEFRIGVHHGDVIEDDERIYGDGVNVAARIEGLAEGGGICISRTSFDSVKNKLNLGYEYLGDHTVKNIAEPVRVYKVLIEPEYAGKVIGEERLRRRQWRWAAIGGVAVLIIVIGALAIWNFYLRPPFERASVERMAFPLPEKPSIAVLPFNNMSGDPEQEFLADGISENIITALSKVPEMFVIARNSTFTYKGKPVKVRQVGEELGVRYILEGSVQKSEERVRVTVQLIDAIKGHHLWSEQYDREVKDFFALLDEITLKIASNLRVKLIVGEQVRFPEYKGNLESWGYVVKGVNLMQRYTKEDNARARRLFERATEIAPEWGSPWINIAWTHWIDARVGYTKSRTDSFKKAFKIAKKVIALDDSDPGAHALLGGIYLFMRQYDKAIAEGEESIALGPSFPEIYSFLAMTLSYAGKPEEAIALIKKAMRLHPYYPWFYLTILGRSYIGAGRYEEALSTYKQCLQLMKTREQGGVPLTAVYCGLAVAYMKLGQEAQARAYVDEGLKLAPKLSLRWIRKASFYKDPAHLEVWLHALHKAGLPETPQLPLPDKPSIAVLPFVNMSGDPGQEYFSDGITEEIITALSKTPRLFVIARTSSFKYKGKEADVRRVGRELGVRYVLEGSVRKAGDKVRITAQLIDALKGHHLWAEQYDRDLKDIFAVQDEITMKILTALQLKLAKSEYALMSVKGTKNLKVYLKYLEALALFVRLNPNDNALARQMTEEVIRMEPKFAAAYNLRAQIAQMDAYFGISPRENFKRAFALAKKSIALDETLATGYFTLGFIYGWQRQHEKAIATIEKGLTFAPSSAVGYFCLGRGLDYAGRHEEGLEMLKRANRMDPFPRSHLYMHLGFAYCNLERYEEAIAALKRATYIQPNNAGALRGLVASYSLAGREEDALIAAKELLRVNPNFSLKRYEKISPYNEALRARLIAALSKAGLK